MNVVSSMLLNQWYKRWLGFSCEILTSSREMFLAHGESRLV
jgi:hypothetical protein